MAVSISSRRACLKMIALMATMVRMLVAFACFVNKSYIIHGVLVLDAFAKLANKFLPTEASMKGIVLTAMVR